MALDEADVKRITEMLAEERKAAAAETAKLLEAQLAKLTKGLQTETTKQLEALKTETAAKLEGLKVEPPKGDPKADPKTGDIENSPALKKLQAEQEKLLKQLEAQTKRAEEAETKRRQDLLSNTVRDALIAQGADAKRVAIAMSHLTSSGAIKLNDKGEPVFTFAEKWGPEEVAAAEGAKKWLATDEGKFFLPPSGKQGTGDGVHREGSRQQGGSAPRTKDGAVDWNQVAGRINLAALEGVSDS